MKKKTSISLDQVIKKSCDTVFNRSGSKRAEPPNSQSIPPKSTSSLPVKSFLFQFVVYYYEAPEQAENHPTLLIWRWICCYLPRPENRESSYHQFKTM